MLSSACDLFGAFGPQHPSRNTAQPERASFSPPAFRIPDFPAQTNAHPSQTRRAQRQFPPAGVLGALRVALMILDDADDANDTRNSSGGSCGGGRDGGSGSDMVTFRTALGRTVRAAVSPSDLTWEMAARVLGRPFR